MKLLRFLLFDNLKLSSSIFFMKYSLPFVRPPTALLMVPRALYFTISESKNPWFFILIVSVKVFIPESVLTSLFLKYPLFSTSILSNFCLRFLLINLCNPPPLTVRSIVPIPASALVLDSDICISWSLILTTKYGAVSTRVPGVVPIPMELLLPFVSYINSSPSLNPCGSGNTNLSVAVFTTPPVLVESNSTTCGTIFIFALAIAVVLLPPTIFTTGVSS